MFLCVGCADGPPGTFAEQVYSRGGEADEEDATESGRSGQGEETKRNRDLNTTYCNQTSSRKLNKSELSLLK